MRERPGELSKDGRDEGDDQLALLERVASIFVDISDLALPTYQFRPE
jgi:hypothetical protein